MNKYGEEYLKNKKTYRAILFRKQKGKCNICKLPTRFSKGVPIKSTRLSIDHIQRISDGGSATDINNMQLICFECHHEKDGVIGVWKLPSGQVIQIRGNFKKIK